MPTPLRPDSDAAPFVHPGDVMDNPAEQSLLTEGLERLDPRARVIVAGLFGELFRQFIPYGRWRGRRSWRAGYRRMVVCAYCVAPEIFGGLTLDELAKQLEVSDRQLDYLVDEIKTSLATRRAKRSKRN